IVLNGQPWMVGTNLEKALRALREIPEVRLGMKVWIDCLCINQNDTAEKAVQVPRMAEIYKTASAVVSWLGDDEDRACDALELLEALGRCSNSDESLEEICSNFWTWEYAEPAWHITKLLMRSYWKRIWIAQEVVLA
ncbi:hypothetical protein K458DRAFT_243759, partial [Lentithecium fluviatile CBS 122367]